MPVIKDQAIALRRLDYSETSQVLLFLTRDHGPRRLIAKGIKRGNARRFATGIDLLERGDLAFSARPGRDSSLGTLTEWRQLDLHVGLRADLPRLYAAQYAAEITAAMTEESDPHPELFDAFAALLELLAADGDRGVLAPLVGYQAHLLTSVGLWPDLTRCLLCGRAAPPGRAAYYAPQQGGLVCRNCVAEAGARITVRGSVLDALRGRVFSLEVAAPAFEVLDFTMTHTLGRQLALSRFVRAMARSS